MELSDEQAAPLYAEADRRERRWQAEPAAVASRRFLGTQHVNWKVGPDAEPCLVRMPLSWQPPMVTPKTFREVDVLRMFADSGLTAKLRHDGGRRHIQEFLVGVDAQPGDPGWAEWLRRAPKEMPEIFAVIARTGPQPADGPRPVAASWVAKRARLERNWQAAWALREGLYTTGLQVPRGEFEASLAWSPTGNRMAVGVHNDLRPANFVLTSSGIKVVDLERFGLDDAAGDLGKHMVATPYPEKVRLQVADRVQQRFDAELPQAAQGLREDAELYRGAYAADQIMGTLHQRITGLEEKVLGESAVPASEALLHSVAADIRKWTSPVLETLGHEPWAQEQLVSALGQWVTHDHPDAPRGRGTSVRRDAVVAATSQGLGVLSGTVNPAPTPPTSQTRVPSVSPHIAASDKRLELTYGRGIDRSLTNS